MNFAVITRDKADKKRIEKLLKKKKQKISTKPDIVVACGGDGTLLIAEREFPGIPKLMLKNSSNCRTCPQTDLSEEEIIDKVLRDSYVIKEQPKIQAQWKRKNVVYATFLATNDFMIRNQLLMQALRFKIEINDKVVLQDEIIGDGVVICTPFGSTGYYHSITKKSIKHDQIGIALNNATIDERAITTSQENTIIITILRMHADFAYDNSYAIEHLEPKDTITITKSDEVMRLIEY